MANNAQDEAFRLLLARRGLAHDEAVARAQAGLPGASLVQSVVRGRLVSPQVASGLLRELAQGSFRCTSCGQVLAYDALSFLERLVCPRCQGPLMFEPVAPPPLGLPTPPPAEKARRSYRRGSAVGKKVGPYTLVKQLGRGSNGVVFLAEREGLKRSFALKILLSSSFEDEEAIARFKLEAAVASKLDETGVIGVYDFGRDGEHYYYAMEYCPGKTLEEELKEGALQPERAARLIAQLAETVHHAHEMGVIHRDLKPANVILDARTGVPRITDFGLARAPDLAGTLTRSGDVLGTPYYMAPEQLRGGGQVEPSIDTYALGVMLYECLCAARPFEAKTVLELSKLVQEAYPTPLSRRVPGLSPALEAIQRKAMAKRPWQRYRSSEELAKDLERFLRGDTPRAVLDQSSTDDAETPAAGRGRALFAGLLSLLVVAALGVAGVALVRGGVVELGAGPSPSAEGASPGPSAALDVAAALESLAAAARARAPTDELLGELARLEAEGGLDSAGLAELRLWRAELLSRRGRHAACLEELDRLEPRTGLADLRRLWAQGVALERQGEGSRAVRSYDALREYDPRGAWGMAGAAAAARLRGQGERALDYARNAVDLDPEHVPALLELALLATNLERDHRRAEELLLRARDHAPDHVRVLLGLALVRGPDSAEGALQILDEAVALTQPDPDEGVLALRAAMRLARGQLAGARQDVESILGRSPRDAGGLFVRGIVHLREGDRRAARADWELAYELEPDQTVARAFEWEDKAERVRIRQALRLDHRGRRRPARLLDVGPALRERLRQRAVWAGEAAESHLLEALVRAAEGCPWGDIEPFFRAAVEAAPDSRAVALEQARILVGREEYDLALSEIERARKLGVDPNELDRLQAEVWWTRGQRNDAVKTWEAVAERDRGVQGACAGARAFTTWRILEHAWAYLERALREDPDHTPSLIAKGMLLDPTEEDELLELEEVIARVLELEGYLNAQVFHLRLDQAIAPVAEDGTIDGDDREAVESVLAVYEEWQIVSSGATPLIMAAQLVLPMPDRAMGRLARMWLAEAHALDPKRAEPLMHMAFIKMLRERDVREDEVLALFRKAKEADPKVAMPSDWKKIYKERFGDLRRLEALAIPLSDR